MYFDVIDKQSIDTFVFLALFMVLEERRLVKDKRIKHGAVEKPSSEQRFHKSDAITFVV